MIKCVLFPIYSFLSSMYLSISIQLSTKILIPNLTLAANYPRYYSLDVFRGATVALMILVNNPGSWAHIYYSF